MKWILIIKSFLSLRMCPDLDSSVRQRPSYVPPPVLHVSHQQTPLVFL